MRIQGLDVSSIQGVMDWNKVKASSREYAFLKCTEGTMGRDSRFYNYCAPARDAGILIGAYHFAYVSSPAEAQIEFFFKSSGGIGSAPGELPPVIDIESPDPARWQQHGITGKYALDWVTKAVETAKKLWGRAPIIYTGPYWWKSAGGYLANAIEFLECKLWVANYVGPSKDGLMHEEWLPAETKNPIVPAPWKEWTFWQHGGLHQPGCALDCDQDLFQGSYDDLRELALLPPEAPTVPVLDPAVTLQSTLNIMVEDFEEQRRKDEKDS